MNLLCAADAAKDWSAPMSAKRLTACFIWSMAATRSASSASKASFSFFRIPSAMLRASSFVAMSFLRPATSMLSPPLLACTSWISFSRRPICLVKLSTDSVFSFSLSSQ